MLRDRIDDQRIVCTLHDLVALLPSLSGPERSNLLIQVCASLAEPRVRQSEVRSLTEAIVKLAVAEVTLVT
jgi:hypothetical protein